MVGTPRKRGPGWRCLLLLTSPWLFALGCAGNIGDADPWPVESDAPGMTGHAGSAPSSGAAGSGAPPGTDWSGGTVTDGSNPPAVAGHGSDAAGSGPMGGAGRGAAGASAGRGAMGAAGSLGAAGNIGAAGHSGAAGSAGSAGAGALVPGGLRWLGRVDATNPNAARFSWSGTGFIGTVHGTSLAVKLRTEGTDTVFFQVAIDGTAGMRFEVKSGADRTVTIASGLSDADHQVELYRETEGLYGVSTFLGFTSGTIVGAPAARSRFIEVVGDSITTGFGNLGMQNNNSGQSCAWSAQVSSWYASYEAIAARELNAEISTVARSGWGAYRDGGGATSGNLASVYGDLLGSSSTPDWTFPREPAAVVINLGTNDWQQGDPGTAFETAYVNFVKQIRTHYPNTWILLTIGTMSVQDTLNQIDGRLRSVVAARASAGDSKVATFDLGIQNSSVTGCGWHPSAAEHQRMSGVLKQQLITRLGWQ